MLQYLWLVLGFYIGSQLCTLVHEAGHYLVARAFGFTVLRFKVGGGRALISFFRGITQFKLCWLPLAGGSVHCLSEQSGSLLEKAGYADYRKRMAANPDLAKLFIESRPNRIETHSPWHVVLFMLAGPVLELGFATGVTLSFAGQRAPLVLGFAAATVLHIAIAISQLAPLYLRNAGTDGFNIILYSAPGLAKLCGRPIDHGVLRKRLKFFFWAVWALVLIALLLFYLAKGMG